MGITKVLTILLLGTLALSLLPSYVSAETPLPFMKDRSENEVDKSGNSKFPYNLTEDLNEQAPVIEVMATTVLGIMFLIGVIMMVYALTTKTGMVLKRSTGILIGVPLFFITVRLFFILFFTTNGTNVTLLVTDILALLTSIGFYAAVGMVLIALIMRLFHKFLNHPEFYRWSKKLYIGAAGLTMLTAIVPLVIQNI
ncbi:hypothetical protein [Halobacillus litoralis]|uniref:Yip1 domain-containing protein n=1 Tax=Halobacillus litoralis TaxID=45668 RepID=A0A410MJH6_9BACI|nr:hypothetical protein [Halobacillus litoralis]QAS54861.1 hypothetical protein HLI_21660 [Halobacillus litoralis]